MCILPDLSSCIKEAVTKSVYVSLPSKFIYKYDYDDLIGYLPYNNSSMIFSEVQHRRSSSLLPYQGVPLSYLSLTNYVGQSRDAISIKLPQDTAIEGIKPHYMM